MEDVEAGLHLLWRVFDQAVDAARDASTPDMRAALLRLSDAGTRATGADATHIHFEQFIMCTVMLSRAFEAGETGEMGDWIQWSLTDAPTDHFVHEMHLGRMAMFHSYQPTSMWPGFHKVMVAFLTATFEYARRLNAFRDVCLNLLTIAEWTFDRAMSRARKDISSADIQLGCFLLMWATVEAPEIAQRMALTLERYVTELRLMEWQRYKFSLTLSTRAGRLSSRGPEFWARYALENFSRHASEMDMTQLMCTIMRTDDDGAVDAEQILVQMERAKAARVTRQSPVAVARDAALTITYVQPFFTRTLEMKRGDLLLRGLRTWYQQGLADEPPEVDGLLVTLPFGETKTSLLCGGELVELQRDTQAALIAVTRAMSSFLGTYETVAGADNSDLPVPERPGLPKETLDGLDAALRDAYCPAGLNVPGEPTAQLILPTEGHPIQATQLTCWDRTWPIASSLTRPRRDRVLRSALVWGGGAGTITADMELEMVAHAFENAGVVVDRQAPDNCTREQFLEFYQRDTYDVVWIASHGEFDHWKAHEVRLQVAPDGSAVDLQDLWGRAPEGDGRRLLVLNICDGARFAQPGLLPRIGLAPGLAAPAQATISHLWPVRPYPSAAFGALLAYHLAEGTGYFDAYVSTLRALRKPARDVAADLARLQGPGFDLVQRLERQEDDFSPVEVWGSAAFFE